MTAQTLSPNPSPKMGEGSVLCACGAMVKPGVAS